MYKLFVIFKIRYKKMVQTKKETFFYNFQLFIFIIGKIRMITLTDAYDANCEKPKETIRARLYDNLGIRFERIVKGVYKTIDDENACVLLEGDGRDLSMFEDNSIDCIFTDHPWLAITSFLYYNTPR